MAKEESGLIETLVPIGARIALKHYGNILKIMSLPIQDELQWYYLKQYKERFIETLPGGEQELIRAADALMYEVKRNGRASAAYEVR